MKDEKKSLLTIVHQTKELEKALIASGGELTPEVEQALLVNGNQLSRKADNYKMIMDRLKMLKSYYADQAKIMSGVAKSCENAFDRLEANIKHVMSENKLDEIKGKKTRFTISETIGSLFLEDIEMVPVEYKFEHIETRINRDALKADLLAGKEVAGAKLVKSLSLRSYANTSSIKLSKKKPAKPKKEV